MEKSDFKPGICYIRNDGQVLNIIGNDPRANFMLVQWLNSNGPFPIERGFFKISDFKELGSFATAQVLLSNR